MERSVTFRCLSGVSWRDWSFRWGSFCVPAGVVKVGAPSWSRAWSASEPRRLPHLGTETDSIHQENSDKL